MGKFWKQYVFTFFILCCCLVFPQQKNIELKGLIVDDANFPIPYAAVGIPSKYIGTASTEEGTFNLLVSEKNLTDSLEVSSIGYLTFKIKTQDFINQKNKTIVLKEDIVSLDEVKLLEPVEYVKLAFKNLKKTTITTPHQLNIFYRRFSSEGGKARFLVEHYLNVLDYGPKYGEFLGEDIVAGRKSADYRFLKKKLNGHPINVIARFNPLRTNIRFKDYKWKKIGDSSYDGEDIVIIEGTNPKNNWKRHRFYIGLDTYGVYKIESGILKSLYVYKKDKNGKLHLSYHNRTRNGKVELNETQKRVLNTSKNTIHESYLHEVYVLGINHDRKIVNSANYIKHKEDMGDINVEYSSDFWKNLNLPPETKFFKKSAFELESIFGVPLETQFKIVNK